MPTYRIETLGCKANLYDSRRLSEALEDLGYRAAEEGETADLCILNSCTVTGGADRKSRQQAGRLARENPGARVYVTGCYASASPEELREVDGVRGVFGRKEWAALLREVTGGACRPTDVAGEFGIGSFDGRTRAFMKIQEGCDAFCSYCILPRVRGAPRSRPLADVRAEAERLAAAGFAEIVLTGIHLGFYGRGRGPQATLAAAVTAVAETEGVERVRLSSLEPDEVDEPLLGAMAHQAVCPHLHLPLQSGSTGVLERMNRRYTPEEFMSVVDLVRRRLDRPAISTDVMVGFPGETDADFEATLQLCREARFSRMHVFPFSPRPGTRAAEMDGRVHSRVVNERSRRLRELGDRMAADWARGFVGRDVRVLFERRDEEGRLRGYTDRYVRLRAEGAESLVGRAVRARVTGSEGSSLRGALTEPNCASP
ncbi:MAG: tRNA (N(6)-L-threonylcarbamoyladenosine(37)-C(2))-methylthiotransferase MtaB [Planctomycetota bacterium]